MALLAFSIAACGGEQVRDGVPGSAETAPAVTAGSLSAAPTASVPDATSSTSATLPSATINDFCLRPSAGDLLFSVELPSSAAEADAASASLRVYRSPVGADGALGPVSVFADLSDSYRAGEAFVERVRCHDDTGQILLSVGNPERMNGGTPWWSELLLLDADGAAVTDHALARDIGPANVAWSPDGSRLLLEANPLDQAGLVYVYDLASENAEPLEGVQVATVTGPGGGWLHWNDGELAILESVLVPGVEQRAIDVVDLSGGSPAAAVHRDFPGALATMADHRGGMIVLSAGSAGSGGTPAPLAALRWDPRQPATGPTILGDIALDTDPLSLQIAGQHVLPRTGDDSAGARVVFVGSVDGTRSLVLADLNPGSRPDVWKISPPDRSAQSVRTSGGWLGYRMRLTQVERDGPFDIRAQIRVIPPADLAPAQIDANPAFQRLAQP